MCMVYNESNSHSIGGKFGLTVLQKGEAIRLGKGSRR
jgi:hypothetical protein